MSDLWVITKHAPVDITTQQLVENHILGSAQRSFAVEERAKLTLGMQKSETHPVKASAANYTDPSLWTVRVSGSSLGASTLEKAKHPPTG